mgnify:CR=1 FL=1
MLIVYFRATQRAAPGPPRAGCENYYCYLLIVHFYIYIGDYLFCVSEVWTDTVLGCFVWDFQTGEFPITMELWVLQINLQFKIWISPFVTCHRIPMHTSDHQHATMPGGKKKLKQEGRVIDDDWKLKYFVKLPPSRPPSNKFPQPPNKNFSRSAELICSGGSFQNSIRLCYYVFNKKLLGILYTI